MTFEYTNFILLVLFRLLEKSLVLHPPLKNKVPLFMEQYRAELQNLLLEYTGTKDALSLKYKPIDDDTIIDKLNFSKVKGSVRLMNKKIKTPSQTNKIVEDFLLLELP